MQAPLAGSIMSHALVALVNLPYANVLSVTLPMDRMLIVFLSLLKKLSIDLPYVYTVFSAFRLSSAS